MSKSICGSSVFRPSPNKTELEIIIILLDISDHLVQLLFLPLISRLYVSHMPTLLDTDQFCVSCNTRSKYNASLGHTDYYSYSDSLAGFVFSLFNLNTINGTINGYTTPYYEIISKMCDDFAYGTQGVNTQSGI